MNDPLAIGVYVFLFIALYFEVFLLITFLDRRPKTLTAAKPTRYPKVAVIVPCYNEERTIAKTIQSLLALDYPKERLSIMVVDDGSKDATHEIARRFTKKGIQVFQKENGGKHTAMNFAIEKTDADIVGCLDADSFVEPQALNHIVMAFERNPKVYAVTPAIKVFRVGNLLESMQKAEYGLSVFYRRMFGALGALFVTPGPFSFYRREVFERIGYFKKAYNTEDMEMAMRMQANHLPIENTHAARVYTVVPKTVRALVRQRVRWVQGFLQNSKDYAFMYFDRRYGTLGLFILPVGLLGIFSALYLAGYSIYTFALFLRDKAVEISTIGIDPSISTPSFNWVFDNATTMTLLVATILPLTITLMALGKRLGGERTLSFDILSYLFIYVFIAPVWLAKAVWNAALARNISWR